MPRAFHRLWPYLGKRGFQGTRERERNFPPFYAPKRAARFPFQIRRLIANKRAASFIFFFLSFFLFPFSFFFFFSFKPGRHPGKIQRSAAARSTHRFFAIEPKTRENPMFSLYTDDKKGKSRRTYVRLLAGAIEFKSLGVFHTDAK